MDRKYHHINTFYNIDSVNNEIGLDWDHTTYDRVDVFIDRINKKVGFAVISYKVYEHGKEIEKQFVPYIDTEDDLKEFLNNCFNKEMHIHYVDMSRTYLYVHADRKEKNHMDLNCVEYFNGKPKRSTYRILRNGQDEILRVIRQYRSKDPRLVSRFDGYYRDPSEIPEKKRLTRRERSKIREASGIDQYQKVKLSMIADIEYLARTIKECTLRKLGLDKVKEEVHEMHYRRRSR